MDWHLVRALLLVGGGAALLGREVAQAVRGRSSAREFLSTAMIALALAGVGLLPSGPLRGGYDRLELAGLVMLVGGLLLVPRRPKP